MNTNTLVGLEAHKNPNVVEKLVPVIDYSTKEVFNVLVTIDVIAVGIAAAKNVRQSKLKRVTLLNGAIKVKLAK